MTKQLAVEETVRGLPAAVKKQWLEVVWVGGGGLGQPTLEKGPSSTGASANNSAGVASESWVGSVRRVTGGIREEILDETTTSVTYTVASGPFPVSEHLGRVEFLPASHPDFTRVVWRCNYTPSVMGMLCCCCGCLLRTIITTSFRRMLRTLAASQER